MGTTMLTSTLWWAPEEGTTMGKKGLGSTRLDGGSTDGKGTVAGVAAPHQAAIRGVTAASDWRATSACRRHRPEAAPFCDLTPREREVAMAVSQGLTNQQVGWLLCISTKTVECHLSRIFVKLDIGSRGQLIAAFAARECPVVIVSMLAPLTARELAVATAAAIGLTNRQVAESLFVSPKTVEFHLAKVYRKLGIRSRRQLSCAVADNRAMSPIQKSA
jgi:DNA-binding NarL/FixJ family response regulator